VRSCKERAKRRTATTAHLPERLYQEMGWDTKDKMLDADETQRNHVLHFDAINRATTKGLSSTPEAGGLPTGSLAKTQVRLKPIKGKCRSKRSVIEYFEVPSPHKQRNT
jgi:hypothetical protein